MVNNLAQLKRALVKGTEFDIVAHARQECVVQRRRVNVADTTGFYSVIPDKPDSRETLANNGRGSYLGVAQFFRGPSLLAWQGDPIPYGCIV